MSIPTCSCQQAMKKPENVQTRKTRKSMSCDDEPAESTDRRLSLNSTTLEEVLDSLLALPSSSQSPSPSGFRPSKWETPEAEPAPPVRSCLEEVSSAREVAKPRAEDIAIVATEAVAAISEDASRATTVAAEYSVPTPFGQSAEGSSSGGSDVGSTGSSSAPSSRNSRAEGEDDGNDRASVSSGSDLTTATTTVASGSSSYRLSGSSSTGDSPSGSGNSQSSSLSASTSASGSGKEVIPPPPDFIDQPSKLSRPSVPPPPAPVRNEHAEELLQEPSEAWPTVVSDKPVVATSGHADARDFAAEPQRCIPAPQRPPPIGELHDEALAIVSSEKHDVTAVHRSIGKEPPREKPVIITEARVATSADQFAARSQHCIPPSPPPKPKKPRVSSDGQPSSEVLLQEHHDSYKMCVETAAPAGPPQLHNNSFASEIFSTSPPVVLCATAASGGSFLEEEESEDDVDQTLPEPRRSESFPPPPTPEQFRELQKLHQTQQQSFDSDVALPLSDSVSSSLGFPSSVQSSSSYEPAEPVPDGGECRFGVDRGACNDRQESFDDIPEDDDDDCGTMDAFALLEPEVGGSAPLRENHSDVPLATAPHDTLFESESVISEGTTAQLRSLDTTREEDILAPDRRSSIMLDDTVIVRCSHVQCKKTAELRDARKTFKTCHNCYTYYCSRECRKDHWARHRRVCMYGRIRSMCKQAIQCSRENPNVLVLLSKLARTGYITQGRGFVKIVFRNTDLAIRFLRQGWSQLEDGPMYVQWRDLIPQEMGDEVYRAVVDLCQRYEPETKFVLLVAIFITREVPVQSVPHWEREVIAKCAKLSLSKFVGRDGHGLLNEDPNTLILTGPQQARGADVAAARKAREVCLLSIQEQLRERGVSLRHQFPDAYSRLCSYVDNDDPFPPLTIYPKDGRTGNTFMCVIMPNSGPQLNDWLKSKVK